MSTPLSSAEIYQLNAIGLSTREITQYRIHRDSAMTIMGDTLEEAQAYALEKVLQTRVVLAQLRSEGYTH